MCVCVCVYVCLCVCACVYYGTCSPDVVFYTSLMHACVTTHGGADLESAHSILYMLEADGLTPSVHTYNQLLAAVRATTTVAMLVDIYS